MYQPDELSSQFRSMGDEAEESLKRIEAAQEKAKKISSDVNPSPAPSPVASPVTSQEKQKEFLEKTHKLMEESKAVVKQADEIKAEVDRCVNEKKRVQPSANDEQLTGECVQQLNQH